MRVKSHLKHNLRDSRAFLYIFVLNGFCSERLSFLLQMLWLNVKHRNGFFGFCLFVCNHRSLQRVGQQAYCSLIFKFPQPEVCWLVFMST